MQRDAFQCKVPPCSGKSGARPIDLRLGIGTEFSEAYKGPIPPVMVISFGKQTGAFKRPVVPIFGQLMARFEPSNVFSNH